jgi:hypothetical protein
VAAVAVAAAAEPARVGTWALRTSWRHLRWRHFCWRHSRLPAVRALEGTWATPEGRLGKAWRMGKNNSTRVKVHQHQMPTSMLQSSHHCFAKSYNGKVGDSAAHRWSGRRLCCPRGQRRLSPPQLQLLCGARACLAPPTRAWLSTAGPAAEAARAAALGQAAAPPAQPPPSAQAGQASACLWRRLSDAVPAAQCRA